LQFWPAKRQHDGPADAGAAAGDQRDRAFVHARTLAGRREARWYACPVDLPDFLDLPPRPAKPREVGLTHVMDKGLGLAARWWRWAATSSTSSSSAGAPRT